MNAQEALNEIVRLFDQMDLPEDYTKFIELKDGFASLQKLVHQSNAKLKTLEELGWKLLLEDMNKIVFGKGYRRIILFKESNSVDAYDISYPEILAIAEKMKELGMTGEQIAKGETK